MKLPVRDHTVDDGQGNTRRRRLAVVAGEIADVGDHVTRPPAHVLCQLMNARRVGDGEAVLGTTATAVRTAHDSEQAGSHARAHDYLLLSAFTSESDSDRRGHDSPPIDHV